MRPFSLLASLLLAAASVQALNAPWVQSRNFNPRNRATKVRTALERRATIYMDTCDLDDPLNPCRTSTNGDTCTDYSGTAENYYCCVAPTAGKRRSHIPGQIFTGDILDPSHAVRFLLSETGTYTHDNGSVMIDHMYDLTRKNQLAKHARRGLISRMAANSLGAFVRVLPKSYFVASHIRDYVMQKDTLLTFSKQTAIDMEDIPEIIKLLLEREDWTHVTVHANKIERDSVKFIGELLATDWMNADDASL